MIGFGQNRLKMVGDDWDRVRGIKNGLRGQSVIGNRLGIAQKGQKGVRKDMDMTDGIPII